MTLLAFFVGVLTWSFLEYVIHRWAGHDRRFRKNLFAKEHIRHHIEGNYFAPTWKKLIVAAVVGAFVFPAAMLVTGPLVGGAYATGFLLFYGAYEVLHRREHTHPGIGAYGRWARRHHFTHHFTDARVNHGVTSPLWDFVFGTYRAPETIKVPRRLCMRWLLDPTTGQVRERFAQGFSVLDKA